MNIVRITSLIILSILAFVLITAAIMSNDVKVERSIVINKPKSEVFEYAKYLKNQDQYSFWAQLDPDMQKEYRGTDGTVGFVSSWIGNEDVGQGEQEITGIVEGEKINYQLRFIKPFESVADSYMSTVQENETSTKVSWGFNSEMPYPMNIMLLFMDMEQVLGEQLQVGLNNMKNIVESKVTPSNQITSL